MSGFRTADDYETLRQMSVVRTDLLGAAAEEMGVFLMRGAAEWIYRKASGGYCSQAATQPMQWNKIYAGRFAALLANIIENWGWDECATATRK